MSFNIDKALQILEQEVKNYQVPVVDLIAIQTHDPFKVLVATILSARTRDEVTAQAAARLFARASTPHALALLDEKTLQQLIYPVGFYKNKARYLAALPEVLKKQFSFQVPDGIEQLTSLPGVGRKTANLVRAQGFGKAAICVDTHVHRIMNIWGYVQTANPLQTEMVLREKLPEHYWIRVNSLLVAFGQGTCRPVGPHCESCVLDALCPRIGVTPRKLKLAKTQKQAGVKRLISWNVNGLRAVAKNGFVDIVRDLAPDILALQEIKALPEQLPDSVREMDGFTSYFNSAPKKGYSGVAIYSREPADKVYHGIGDQRFDEEGRVLTLEFGDFYLVNCYFPNSRHDLSRLELKQEFNCAVHNFIKDLARDKSVVICGDFNVAHTEIDLANPAANTKNAGFTPEERKWMDSYIEEGWIDTFRQYNQEPGQYSWWSYRSNARERNIGWRIDYFFVDSASKTRIVGADILADILGSDHCPVTLDFK
ncbi:MAG: exodeoxyribonuclease III [Proteobacteria bacterium]|jgi:exodeoxyribonuclease-3|nr:exodeoxyribonuclease III [Desulfocapsa sp.]MBU3944323.1 exodeoxyribonuclease III [Pseudomonadota bacterium]MCG2744090.1 exodeoxyribonuclease III [Desulfobacteraceae bacterium]MBU3982501.1 exodeoxyribonuclease III [Pseudomonadota bacterium]MBU4028092.1 exodeoxyribonuclease III [Pseudomonadota bacterium]